MYSLYICFFGLSVLLTALYVSIWRKHFDVNITLIFALIPIVNLGYIVSENATDIGTFIVATKIIYLGGCYLPILIAMSILSLCEIKVNRVIRLLGFAVCTILYLFVLSIGYLPYYYKSITFNLIPGGREIIKEYGPAHTFFYVYTLITFIVGFSAITYSLMKKKQVPNSILYLLFLPDIISIAAFFGFNLMGKKYEIMPVAYVFAQFVYILISRRMSLYRVSDMVVESMVMTGDTGFITVDKKKRFLGANETAKEMIPELRGLSVDQKIDNIKTISHWIEHFEEDNRNTQSLFVKKDDQGDEKIYAVNTSYLYDLKRRCGYRLFLTDDTKNQKYIKLLDKYNEELEEEVEKKTENIIEMHNNLILSMATMVESRDNSTGGHIRRTSECVRILMDEIMKENPFGFDEEFCKNIIKAAPMHDLGKVAVDDAVLRKPGRFTPEEFDKMKAHAAEGARIVHEILKDTDDESFKVIAENVAHYHHERMDGSGYPEGLKGDQIPVEARIMAIADVYDALVSKRVYKESMSFEQADNIMMDSMGKHFDKRLEKFYVSSRKRLEDYYRSL